MPFLLRLGAPLLSAGVFDPLTFNGEVPGNWVTLDGRVPRHRAPEVIAGPTPEAFLHEHDNKKNAMFF